MKASKKSTPRSYRTPLLWGGTVVVLVIGGFLHYVFFTKQRTWIDTSCLKDYPLTSRSLDCEMQDQAAARMQAVESTLETEAARHIAEGHATRVSIWVRDLETRRWAAANETELFAPASMLKVPIMISYFKLAELEPAILSQELVYEAAANLGDDAQTIPSGSSLVVGQSYTAERLIEDMVIHSDNNAMHVLIANIGERMLTHTMNDLGIIIPKDANQSDFVTARSFANMFRSLYNASYLDRAHSQKALDLLSRSEFKLLTKEIPQPPTVASKFGERVAKTPDGTVLFAELHECGIVYASPNPYSICILTQGKNLEDLTHIITEISSKVYAEMQ